MSRSADGVGDIDFDTSITWERSNMHRAIQVFNGAGITYERRGRAWLRIKLCEHAALYFAPGSGSLRFEKGKDLFVEGPTTRAQNYRGLPIKFPPLA
jgi:hypothetical protein